MGDTLTITDNRTGTQYEVPIAQGTIRAMDLRQIKTSADDFGLMTYDPAFQNTASCRSSITFIDGDKGILEYLRAIPASDRDKQEAVDLTLQGGVACLLGLLFPPLLLLGAIPLFYGLRKLLYASMGLGLVADDTTPTANPVEDETPPSE